MSNLQQNITETQKLEIIDLIIDAGKVMGTDTAVANRCGVSAATISQMGKNQYVTKGDEMWRKVGAKLGWRPAGWVVVDTTNIKACRSILEDAQKQALFIRIAEKAGSGKTTSITHFMANNKTANIYRIVCRDWSKREFLNKLCQALGINQGQGYKSQDALLETIINFFTVRKGRPLLIIDQANSLKPSVLGFLIHLFNECEDKLGVIIAGTEHLRIDFERGVKYSRKGYDELDSRFGRSFVTLVGNTSRDTALICAANGIEDKEVQFQIFQACNPTIKSLRQDGETKTIKVVEDGRLIKRAIIRHHLLAAISTN